MAWVLPADENEGQDKRVESIYVPCLDAGSTPASSTLMRRRLLFIPVLLCAGACVVMAQEVRKPDTQIADNTFFDPTRKEKVEEEYHFGVDYRIEVGFAQNQQRTKNLNYPDMYLHGARLGATFNFQLPIHFSIETGVLYSLLYGRQQQHWRSVDAPSVQEEYLQHRILEHNITIPVRCYYNIPLWKQLNMFFLAGPQLHIGLAETDYILPHLSGVTQTWLESQGIPTSKYDRMSNELVRANIQLCVGMGFEWDRYRIQGGYDFGLNNQIKTPKVSNQHMWEWGWYVSFCYKLK